MQPRSNPTLSSGQRRASGWARITGVRQGALEVAIGAPPVDGEANGELVRFLAKLLGVPRSSIALASGAASRQKTIAIAGIDDATLRRALVK